uniref:DUF19 domain-containing protein n=1 Tax=Plectus sambesii TaxID=2011161 RepID=A0A914UJ03_9BILA
MAFSTSAALLTLVALASCRNINVSNKCNSDADKTSIGRCVRPWLDLWELQRTRETAAAELVFPLVFYARESVLALCDLYTKSRDDCLTDRVVKTCSSDSMISFVESHMKYFCGERGAQALSRFECLNKAVKSNPACREHIRGIPLPNHQASKCLGMPQFYKCIEPEIDRRCGASGLAVMVQAIDAFGCKFSDPISDKSGEVQASLRRPASPPAARPKLRSDVVKALEQSNSTETPISALVEQSDIDESSSAEASLTESTSRGPGLILMSSSAEHGTTEEPEARVTKLRDLAPKRSTTRGPGLIMLPRDALFASWRAVAEAGRSSAEYLEERIQNLTLPPTTAAANQKPFAAIAASNSISRKAFAALPAQEIQTDIQPVIEESLSSLQPDPLESGSDNSEDELEDDYEWITPESESVPVKEPSVPEPSNNAKITLPIAAPRKATSSITEQPESETLAGNPLEGSGEVDEVEEIVSTNAAENATSPALTQPPLEEPEYLEGSGEEEETDASASTKSAAVNELLVDDNASAKTVAEGELEQTPEGSGEEEVGSGEADDLQESNQLSSTSSSSDPSHDNITSTIGALEKKITTTQSPASEAETLSPASAANSFCDKEKEIAIGNCFLPLSKRWEGINAQHPDLSEVIFPLFNYSTAELLGLCEVLQVTIDDCLSTELLISCSENDFVKFVNSLLGYACAREHHTEFFMNYDCTAMVMHQNQNCFAHIAGKALPGMPTAEKCANMPAFYDCMESQVAEKCSPEAKQTFLRAILNFGCDVAATPKKSETKKENVDVLPVVDDDRENKVVDAPVALPPRPPTTAEQTSTLSTPAAEETSSATGKTTILTTATPAIASANEIDESTSAPGLVPLSPDCTVVYRARARKCVEPLMTTWTRIRKDKPQLNNITFPLYKYQREELLELCDGYANVFLCAGFDPIQKCLTDEMVRFANDHLGYICSPQNIVNFMRHYDCIMDLVGRSQNSCVPLIRGKSVVGEDAEKCKGVPDFYSCMKGSIELNCRATALQEFEGTVSQFGCELSS